MPEARHHGPDHTTALVERCVLGGVLPAANRTAMHQSLEGACASAECMLHPPLSAITAYGFRRRHCPGATDRSAYASDLLKFRSTLEEILSDQHGSTKRGAGAPSPAAGPSRATTTDGPPQPLRATRLIWHASSPQHYQTPGGLFPVRRSDTWPWSGARQRCVPHSTSERNLAYGRVADAQQLLGPLRASVPRLTNGTASFSFRSTWERDARLSGQHPGSDAVSFPPGRSHASGCTHFCLHSDATLDWLRELGELVLDVARAGSEA